MGSHSTTETFTFYANPRPVWTVIKVIFGLSIVGAVFIAIGVAIAWALGDTAVQENARITGAAWMLATLYFAWKAAWSSQLVFRHSEGIITARCGRGRVRGRATRFDVHKPMLILLGKGRRERPLTLWQEPIKVHLGLDVDVFPDPYLELVAWIRGQGVHLIELVTYPDQSAARTAAGGPRRRGSVVRSARRRRTADGRLRG
jgi:hypothetical protein